MLFFRLVYLCNIFPRANYHKKMKKLTGNFRNTQWDPLLIISQIIAFQSVLYLGLGIWMLILNDLIVGSSRSLDHLFKYQVILNFKYITLLLSITLL